MAKEIQKYETESARFHQDFSCVVFRDLTARQAQPAHPKVVLMHHRLA